MSPTLEPPPSSLDPLNRREREDLIGWATKILTFEAAAAIELRGRITTAIKLLDDSTDPAHVVAVLEGRQPW